MDEELKPEDLINIREMNKVAPRPGPVVDKLVSEAIGKTVYVNNPVLIRKIAEWKKAKGESEEPDNFLADPVKVEELKKLL